jgi:hypothetical protein
MPENFFIWVICSYFWRFSSKNKVIPERVLKLIFLQFSGRSFCDPVPRADGHELGQADETEGNLCNHLIGQKFCEKEKHSIRK